MTIPSKSIAMALFASSALTGFAGPALAEAPQEPTAAIEPGNTLETVVVTAQRRSENLQQIPIAVSAFSDDRLKAQNIASGVDLGKLVPSLSLSIDSGTVEPYMRGVGNNVSSAGNEAAVAVYVDNVYYSRLTPSLLRLNNIDHVEVLKGPQGTLFGRNSEGGLINILTRSPRPGAGPSANLAAGYGSFGTFESEGSVAGSFGDKLAADVSAIYYNEPGWGRNIFNNSRLFFDHEFAIRSQVVFAPTDSTKITASVEYANSRSDIGISGQSPGGPYLDQGNLFNPAQLASGPPFAVMPHIGFYDRSENVNTYTSAKHAGGHITIDQDLGFAKLVNIVAYQHQKEIFAGDTDYTPAPYTQIHLPSFTKQFTEEFQLQSLHGSTFDWTVGAFYINVRRGYSNAMLFGPGYTGPLDGLTQSPGSATTLLFNTRGPVNAYAFYTQETFHLTPKLNLTLGGRYSHDEVGGEGVFNYAFRSNGATIIPLQTADEKTTSTKFSYKAALAYQWTGDLMTYVSTSRGYKAGLYNLLPIPDALVKPEVLTSYEIGLKGEFLDSKLRVNAAAFYYDVTNPQVQLVEQGLLVFANAGAARVKGIDVDAQYAVSHNFTIFMSAGYMNSEYTDYKTAPFYNPGFGASTTSYPAGLQAPITLSAKGQTLPHTPKFTGNIGGSYKIPVDYGEWTLSGGYSYTGSFFWAPDNRVKERTVNLVDAKIALNLPSRNLTISVWGSNLAGEKYQQSAYELVGQNGDSGSPAPPRQFGVRLEYAFR